MLFVSGLEGQYLNELLIFAQFKFYIVVFTALRLHRQHIESTKLHSFDDMPCDILFLLNIVLNVLD